MLNNDQYQIGTIVTLNKPHPSGTVEWEVVRLGADIKLKSTIDKALFIMMPRVKFNRRVKEVIKY